MAKTIDEKIAIAQEEKQQKENEIKRLMKSKREEERKARIKRLCQRGGYLESRLPETITLTDEQYKALLEKTLFSKFAREIIDGMIKRNEMANTNKNAGNVERSDTGTGKDEGNGARVMG